MAGGGGPTPKGKQVEQAMVTHKTTGTVTFEVGAEDAAYFELGKSYRLIAIDKD